MYKSPFHRSPFNFDSNEWSDVNGLECLDLSLTRQADKDEADINTIVKNFGLTGRVPNSVRVPEFGDFDVVNDYQSAIHAVRSAEASFMAMDANVRSRFEHSPQLFLEFCSDPANLDEMRKLGLAVPVVEPAATPVV